MTCTYTEGRPTWAGPLARSRGDAIRTVRFATFRVGNRAGTPNVLFPLGFRGATMPTQRPSRARNENGPAGGRGRLVVLRIGREEEGRGIGVPLPTRPLGSTAALGAARNAEHH